MTMSCERTSSEWNLRVSDDECAHCGGSGVLNVVAAHDGQAGWQNQRYAAACHACLRGFEMGQIL